MNGDPNWMQTFTGRAISFPIEQDMLDIRDIAHSLSLQCRYAGHCRRFYSVAEHSVLLAQWFYDQAKFDAAKTALMHDAAEAYLTDIPAPWKGRIPGYTLLELQAEAAIAERFRFVAFLPEVKAADQRILWDEKDALMGPSPREWHLHPDGPLGVRIEGWGAREAERRFYDWYNTLFGANVPTGRRT